MKRILSLTLPLFLCITNIKADVPDPAYVLKFIELLPSSKGPLPHCDYDSLVGTRNPCDYRVRMEVFVAGDPKPYFRYDFDLPDDTDFFVAEPNHVWPKTMPNPSYPGTMIMLGKPEYEKFLQQDRNRIPVEFRVTIFDRDEFGTDLIAKQTFQYPLNDMIRNREQIQTADIPCVKDAKCTTIRLKFMFYMLYTQQWRG